ncbi:DUF2243 domain-containing protein [Paenibacillus humicola]|uniref:DUF2243 domain-containing protein n=1 Tax=Paenibacillus humicola TaxID=3110540 RepID=UPI00237B4A35|nr:DUF2243 domain-containing protein [Paenibacillus humicola]
MRTFWGAFWLGVGIVGMLDGIIFHQILQWHSVYMHTDRFHQIVSDGFFHLGVTVVVAIGAWLLWQSSPDDFRHRAGTLGSGLFVGAGCFNLVEGVIDHHFLRIHHVRPGAYQMLYDLAYDAMAIIMIGIGLLLYNSGKVRAR